MAVDEGFDGCTFFPDGRWRDCCDEHDRAYRDIKIHHGDWRARRRADLALMRCVRERSGSGLAILMYLGVRFFGFPYWVMNRWEQKIKEANDGIIRETGKGRDEKYPCEHEATD